MKQTRFFIVFAALCLAQALIDNYFLFTQYLLISLLPLLVMGLPTRYNTPAALLLSFVSGFIVDFLGTGTLGLTCCALLPVALLRIPLLNLVSGEEIMTYRDDTPTSHQTMTGTALTMAIACAIFFMIYIWVDAAGTRPFWFNFVRLVLSTAVSTLLCVLLNNFLFRRNR